METECSFRRGVEEAADGGHMVAAEVLAPRQFTLPRLRNNFGT
jgi:hypothetical protein